MSSPHVEPVLDPHQHFFRLDEVAALLHVRVSTIRRWCEEGTLQTIRLPGIIGASPAARSWNASMERMGRLAEAEF